MIKEDAIKVENFDNKKVFKNCYGTIALIVYSSS